MKFIAALATGLALLTTLQDPPKKREMKDRVEIAGTIVCIGCTLSKDYGVEAQCTLHAKHAQGLLASDGTLWTFVDNSRGHIIITNEKLRGKEGKVFGWKYPQAQYIELWKYQLKEGANWVAYDYCKTCGFEKGDHQDKDVCEDCEK